MIDAGFKKIIDWFSSEYPDFDLIFSPLMTGVSVIVKQETKSGVYASRKDLLIGRDYTDETDVFEKIRAAISAAVEEIQKNKITVSPTGQQSFFNFL